MSYKFLIFILFCSFLLQFNLSAQNQDTLKNYWLKPVEINAYRLNLGEYSNDVSKDNLKNIFNKNGFNLIRKGVFFAQDIYADGFKRGDINVTIDGERYHSACPNRMDSPLTRVNLLELESVELSKNSCNIQSGLGGVVQFQRSIPSENLKLQVGMTAIAGSQQGIDFAGSTDYLNNRLSLRYADGKPYTDGSNKSFQDSYNYEENYKFKLAEGSLRGKLNQINYGLSFSYTENVSFPYLLMDEKVNRVYSAFLRYNKHKIYFNYTDHMMDNTLRKSSMLMRTTAKNITIGAIGDFYEFIYRNWDANNFFKSPIMTLENDLMPNVSLYNLNLFKTFDFDIFNIYSKLGLSYQNYSEKSRKEFYSALYENIETNRIFPIFSLGITYTTPISNFMSGGILGEVASESPDTESLFIAVKKPMGKPTWSGNPNLKQPIRLTLRGSLNYDNIVFELYGTNVWNYVNLSKVNRNEANYLTYNNVNALLLGSNLSLNYKYFEFNASYTLAENKSNNSPLAEIAPLTISSKIVSPEFYGFIASLKHTYNDAQTRIDRFLNESSSASWNRLDFGLAYSWNNLSLSIDIENLLDANYYQHLSYLRDPFASGLRVYDPGRIVRISFKTSQLL